METFEKNEQELYDGVLQSINKIILICGKENVKDASLDLNDEKYEIYKKEYRNIINTIGDIVRLQERPFDFTPLLRDISDVEFWEDIKKDVERIVKNLLTVIPYRKLDEQTRLELLEKSFGIIYLERECKNFLMETLGDSELSDAIYVILMESEFIIVSNYASKRLFKNALSKKIKLEDNDLDLIWNLYQENFSTILTVVSLKNHFRLMDHIRYLVNRVDDLEDCLLTLLED